MPSVVSDGVEIDLGGHPSLFSEVTVLGLIWTVPPPLIAIIIIEILVITVGFLIVHSVASEWVGYQYQ